MKKLLLLFAFLLFSHYIAAQQIQQLSQYMVNDFAYNPGVTGNDNLFVSKFAYRKQWVGIEGSPSTAILSVHGNLDTNKKIGVGGMLYSDVTGPTRRTGLQLSYAYHIPLDVTAETFLGLGIAGNFLQYGIDFNDLVLYDPTDTQIGVGRTSSIGADANLGAYLRHTENEVTQYYVGFAVNQLFASKFKFDSDFENIRNARHAYIMGGYKFAASEKLDFEPGVLGKFVKGTRAQAELNLKAIYDDQYWLGLSYRTEDALAILLGFDLSQGFNFTYSYDITTSALNAVSSGSHEITIGYNFYVAPLGKDKK